MATKTVTSTLTVSELAEAILNSCNGLSFATVLGDCVTARLGGENITAPMGEIVEALRLLVGRGQLRLKDFSAVTGISVYLEFVKA